MSNSANEKPNAANDDSSRQESLREYRERMFGDNYRCECDNQRVCTRGNDCYYKKAKAALDRAHEIRKFEIELLWKRAAYVATFQTLLFAALGLSFRAQNGDLIPLFQIVTCIAGVFSSFFWRLINKGSKFWHENWTHHIDFLEDEFEGRLHKTVLYDGDGDENLGISNKILLDAKTQPYSVSRVNISISNMFFVAWSVLLLVFLWQSIKSFGVIIASDFFVKAWLTLSCIPVLVLLFILYNNKLKSKFSDVDPERDVRWARREPPNIIKMSSGKKND